MLAHIHKDGLEFSKKVLGHERAVSRLLKSDDAGRALGDGAAGEGETVVERAHGELGLPGGPACPPILKPY